MSLLSLINPILFFLDLALVSVHSFDETENYKYDSHGKSDNPSGYGGGK